MMPLYREATKLEDYYPLDCGVWFNNAYLIGTYDSMHTVFLRQTGEEVYHGPNLDEAKAAAGLGDDSDGESYDIRY